MDKNMGKPNIQARFTISSPIKKPTIIGKMNEKPKKATISPARLNMRLARIIGRSSPLQVTDFLG